MNLRRDVRRAEQQDLDALMDRILERKTGYFFAICKELFEW